VRYILQTLYELKRKFPTSLVLKKFGKSQVDLDAETVLTPETTYEVDRAVALPYTQGILKQSGLGLYADITQGERIVVIDLSDLPYGFTPDKDDVVTLDGNTWRIVRFMVHEGAALELLLKDRTT
jgi:hypothetical protein